MTSYVIFIRNPELNMTISSSFCAFELESQSVAQDECRT